MSEETDVAALLAGVGALEETARAAMEFESSGEWEAYELPERPNGWKMTGVGVVGDEMGHRTETMFPVDAAHIAAVDPVFVLGLCAAIRQVVERVIQVPLDDFHPGEVHPQVQWLAHHTLTTLARAFAGSGT